MNGNTRRTNVLLGQTSKNCCCHTFFFALTQSGASHKIPKSQDHADQKRPYFNELEHFDLTFLLHWKVHYKGTNPMAYFMR